MGSNSVPSIGEKNFNVGRVPIFMMYWLDGSDITKSGAKIEIQNRTPIVDAMRVKYSYWYGKI